MKFTNEKSVPLPLAVWAIHDDYDYIPGSRYISATTLLKPVRQIILGKRLPYEERVADVSDFIKSSMGRALHDSIEKAWKHGYRRSLSLLGYPEHIIDRVRINPKNDELKPDTIPVYVEQRLFREFNGWKIGGKFDMISEGILNDFKSTSAYTWMFNSKNDDYIEQGSIYNWLDAGQSQKKITEDFIKINFIFTDWQKSQAKTNPEYPQNILESKKYKLFDLAKTEKMISHRLSLIERYENSPESEIPECTDEELWMSETVYKYYSDPTKTEGRATKNFTSASEANAFKASKGKGVVIAVEGTPKRCEYCPVYEICSQKDKYFNG